MNSQIPTTSQPLYRPSLWLAVRRAGADYYERMGLTVLGSLFTVIPVMLFFLVEQALSGWFPRPFTFLVLLLASWYWLTYAWAANVLLAHRIAYWQDPGMDAFVDLGRLYGKEFLKLSSVQLLITLIILADIYFFSVQTSLAMRIAGVVMLYVLFLWGTSLLWQWPFLIREAVGTVKILKKSALVLLDNPFFTVLAFSVTMLCGILLLASVLGMLVALSGLLSCFVVRAHRETLKKYGVVEDEPDIKEDSGWPSDGKPPRRLNPRNRLEE